MAEEEDLPALSVAIADEQRDQHGRHVALEQLRGELGAVGAHQVDGAQHGDEDGGADDEGLGDEQPLQVGEHAVAGDLAQHGRLPLEVVDEAREHRAHRLHRPLVGVREPLRQRGQRGLDVGELVADHVLAAAGGDLEGVALRRQREEVDVGEAGADTARLRCA